MHKLPESEMGTLVQEWLEVGKASAISLNTATANIGEQGRVEYIDLKHKGGNRWE